MTLQLDLDGRVLRASIGALTRRVAVREAGATGGGLARMWMGQHHHQRIQGERVGSVAGYQPEHTVHGSLTLDDWTLELSGRADGVVMDADGRVLEVEEIKTVQLGRDLFGPAADERRESHRRQVQLYARLLSPPDQPATAILTLVDVIDGRVMREEVTWDAGEVDRYLRGVLQRLVGEALARRAHREACARAGAVLPFPHPTLRPHQGEMVDAVEGALAGGRHLLVAAPTGVGKTAAALYPALRQALGSGRKVFFLTAKTLQQKMAVQTARAMQTDEAPWRSLQLRAKAAMCANSEMVCAEEACPYAEGYAAKVAASGIAEKLLDQFGHLDPDVIFETAKDLTICPFELSLELRDRVDLVVCDYNYVFDPRIGMLAMDQGELLSESLLVIDEAHNLVDRAREYYSPTLSRKLVTEAIEQVANRTTRLFTRLHDVLADLRDAIDDELYDAFGSEPAAGGVVVTELDDSALYTARAGLDPLIVRYVQFKREQQLWTREDPVMSLYFTLVHFHRVLCLGGDEFVHLARRTGDDEQLRVLCLDASRFVGENLRTSAGVAAMSATLEPFDFYRDLLGFDRSGSDTLALPSPFPPENRQVLVAAGVDTTYRQRARSYGPIAELIAEAAPEGRNALALFPSYRFLDEVAVRLHAPQHQVEIQRSGADKREQLALLETLQNNGRGRPVLLLAVLGGMFAEGVDYPGDALSAVFVVSPGLPQVEPERDLLREYFQREYGDGFGYAYLVPGLRRVVQAAGRLIRGADDRGVVMLVGRRFLQRRYAEHLPWDWTGDNVRDLKAIDPAAEVRAFFDEVDIAADQPAAEDRSSRVASRR